MIVLQASHIHKSFGDAKILDDVTLTVKEGEKIGLVGRNGAGKTTLLKILTGQLPPDAGDIICPKTVTLGYLAQQGGLQSNRTVWEEMMSVFDHLITMEEKISKLEFAMGRPENAANPVLLKKITEEYTDMRESFARSGGYEYQAAVRGVLHGLQFGEEYYHIDVDRLSGGEKTRLALAKLLLAKPAVLILDEPTNYLDMETLGWLEKYLQTYTGAILTVSHDRYFLDTLAEAIYELEFSRLKRYNGNYSRYLVLKAGELEQQAKQYRKQQEEITRLQEFVRRNIARASTTGRAKSKQKLLEKIKPLDKPQTDNKKINISMGTTRSSGKEVLAVRELDVGYRGRAVARNITFSIHRGERVALLGPNGTGKTTLLKTVAGMLPPLSGSITKGYHVSTGYYDQEQKHLSGHKQVIEELWDEYPQYDEQTVRSILGNFLFSGEDVFKNVADLSGGEKARLALAKLMCHKANFLLLDEPTSHLDILGNEAMEEALLQYPGTLLFVSHDRYFINKIATRVIELTPDGVFNFPGNFDDYQNKKAARAKDRQQESKHGQASATKQDYLRRKEKQREERKAQRRTEELENLITVTETEIFSLEQELYLPEVYNDHEVYRLKNSELEKLRARLEKYMEEWVKLTG
ncbi:ABC-F family ATP-binding cassette domain-containing protein [Desulfallas thermosapovorans]|uniref:ATP-binding cassette subfamily F protein 3 n=1 Tax=Desulfallas thermosapovorans DSM 6562 TaxID=1121431 RepID=A0A5S4ZTG2_9FIRM|nr:ABC-F family ATP-binding cassette domain-containing protein [Desulfallas thermosapovorans]TYO95970.1 ATP-binding cassette subfamily F protein 3 [Desulfallas thermosapovorans DSM 6562]